MKSIVKIQAMGLEKLNNAEFANFMSRFSDLVNTTGTRKRHRKLRPWASR